MGGKLPRIYIMNESQITDLGNGEYSIILLHNDDIGGSTAFFISEIERLKRSEFNVFANVVMNIGGSMESYSTRVNLASASAREGSCATNKGDNAYKELSRFCHRTQVADSVLLDRCATSGN